MKTFLLMLLALMLSECRPKKVYGCNDTSAANYDPAATHRGTPDPCIYNGELIFWQSKGQNSWTVSIAGQTAAVTSSYSAAPPCGSQGCATFKLAAGKQQYTVETSGLSWVENVVVLANSCTDVRVH